MARLNVFVLFLNQVIGLHLTQAQTLMDLFKKSILNIPEDIVGRLCYCSTA